MQNWKLETLAVQGGYMPHNGEPRVLPIAMSTTFKYDTTQEVADLFDLKCDGFFYSRLGNPTCDAFERKVANLEGGVGALSVSSGQTATFLAVMNILSAGDHIVVSSTIYGGTFNLFAHTLPRFGVEVTFIDPTQDISELRKAFKPNTKALFGETLSNPGTDVLDFDKFSALAKEFQVPFIVDNTFPSPYLCQPIKYGANIVIHSATKYIDGHATCVGGVIIDGGNFDWTNGKFPEFTQPDDSYHGLIYTQAFGKMAYIVKCRVQLLRDLGTIMSPMVAFELHKSLETLHIRMERHSQNALKLAEFLENHPLVNWVKYPFLKKDPNYALAQKYLKAGSGVLTFGVKGGKVAGAKFMDNLKLAAIVVHVADVRTSVLHPASMTHRQLNEEEQIACGVLPDLVRVSVGIESIDDIIADFDQALKISQQ